MPLSGNPSTLMFQSYWRSAKKHADKTKNGSLSTLVLRGGKVEKFIIKRKGGIDMLVCAICGKALKECCDLFHEAITPDGETVVVCNDCAIENDLQFEDEIEEK